VASSAASSEASTCSVSEKSAHGTNGISICAGDSIDYIAAAFSNKEEFRAIGTVTDVFGREQDFALVVANVNMVEWDCKIRRMQRRDGNWEPRDNNGIRFQVKEYVLKESTIAWSPGMSLDQMVTATWKESMETGKQKTSEYDVGDTEKDDSST
jgi:hypothetical protein